MGREGNLNDASPARARGVLPADTWAGPLRPDHPIEDGIEGAPRIVAEPGVDR